MSYQSPIVITGPTSTGKTDVAFQVALRLGGAGIISGDKFTMYRDFPICTGLSDIQENLRTVGENSNISAHLYGFLSLDDEAPSVYEYRKLVDETSHSIMEKDRLPIVEGCYPKFHFSLIDTDSTSDIVYSPRFGIICDLDEELRKKVKDRVIKAFEAGLVDEVESKVGNTDPAKSFIMAKSVVVGPILDYINDNADKANTQDIITDGVCRLAKDQYDRLMKDREITWLRHDPKNMGRTVEKILDAIDNV